VRTSPWSPTTTPDPLEMSAACAAPEMLALATTAATKNDRMIAPQALPTNLLPATVSELIANASLMAFAGAERRKRRRIKRGK